MKQRRDNFKNQGPERTKRCNCGGEARLLIRKNYPFGSKSKAVVTKTYKCSSCNAVSYV